jgi:NAD-dependent deacetylase
LTNVLTQYFFTGAGISTDSGIPDFRGPNGFWKKNKPIYFQDFIDSAEMRDKYWEQSIQFKSNFEAYAPNFGHEAIANIIDRKKNGHCITQNVDNLHQDGGLQVDQVTEIHGNATYAVCLDCSKAF